MSLNFPNNPISGSTYSFNGVKYTYKVSGSEGYWTVVGVGTYGVATASDINIGTDNVKYITAAGLEGSNYKNYTADLDAIIASIPTNNNQLTNGAGYYKSGSDLNVSTITTTGDVIVGGANIQVTSDARDKYDVEDLSLGLDFINSLTPKFYKYNLRDGEKSTEVHAGFLAQDVKESMDNFGVDFSLYVKQEEDKLALCYQELIAIQAKAIQELTKRVEKLESK